MNLVKLIATSNIRENCKVIRALTNLVVDSTAIIRQDEVSRLFVIDGTFTGRLVVVETVAIR